MLTPELARLMNTERIAILTGEQVERVNAMAQHKGCRLSTKRIGDDHPTIVVSAPGYGEWVIGKFRTAELAAAFDEAKKVFHAVKARVATA